MTLHGKDNPRALALAQLFSTCVEAMLLIHPSKEWDRAQRLLIAKVGIQQGRLLAWGAMLGICELDSSRDPRLDEPETHAKIEKALQDIIDRPVHTDRTTQFEKYGLKPPKKFIRTTEPALDAARLDAFREKLEILQQQRWEVRRGMSITITHWSIVDSDKFATYLALIREQVDFVIGLMGIEDGVNRAMKYDIKALGWHPVFERRKAASDMSKLRLIKDACAEDYPEYAAATQGALDYLDKEWKDSYQEAMERGTYGTGSEIPGAAAYTLAQSTPQKDGSKSQHTKRPGIFSILRPKSWRKGSRDEGRSQSVDDSTRSKSIAVANPPPSPPLTPERSKSISALSSRPAPEIETTAEQNAEKETAEPLSRVDTTKSTSGYANLGPITSMISRHDQWRNPI
jgi:hypothetical protein